METVAHRLVDADSSATGFWAVPLFFGLSMGRAIASLHLEDY